MRVNPLWFLAAIVTLEGFALYQNVDGKTLSLAIGGICYVAGFIYGRHKKNG